MDGNTISSCGKMHATPPLVWTRARSPPDPVQTRWDGTTASRLQPNAQRKHQRTPPERHVNNPDENTIEAPGFVAGKIKGVGGHRLRHQVYSRQTDSVTWLTCFSSEHYRGHDGVQVHKSVRKRYALEIAIWQRVRSACSLARRRSGSARGCLRWRFYSSDGTLVEDAFVVNTAHCTLPAG